MTQVIQRSIPWWQNIALWRDDGTPRHLSSKSLEQVMLAQGLGPVERAAVRAIVRRIRALERAAQNEREQEVREVYSRYRYYVTRGRYCDGGTLSLWDCKRATARDMQMTAQQVSALIVEAEQCGWGE